MTSCNGRLDNKIQDTSDNNINNIDKINSDINANEYNNLSQENNYELLNHIKEFINKDIWFKGIYSQFYNMASQTYDAVFYKQDDQEEGIIYAIFQQKVIWSSYFQSKTSEENWEMYYAIGFYKDSKGYIDTYDIRILV